MRPTLQNLQALRGLACLVVVGFHLGMWEHATWSKWRTFHAFRWFGFAGVDVFFVLSGFIITWAHRGHFGRREKLPRYVFRRLWRIYPALWASCAVAGLLAAATGKPDVFGAGWGQDWAEWLLLVPRADPFPHNTVTWSLYYELLFYVAFGVLFVLPSRAAMVAGIGWGTFVLAARLFTFFPDPHWARMTVSPFVLEFLGGATVAAVVSCGFVRGPRVALGVAGAWAAGGTYLFRGPTPEDLGGQAWARVIVFGPACVLLVYAVVAGELTHRIGLPRRLRPVGDASYSLYLLHAPFGLCVAQLATGLNTSLLPHVLWLALVVGSGLGAGWLLYRLVERPLLTAAKAKPAHTSTSETRTPVPFPFSPR